VTCARSYRDLVAGSAPPSWVSRAPSRLAAVQHCLTVYPELLHASFALHLRVQVLPRAPADAEPTLPSERLLPLTWGPMLMCHQLYLYFYDQL
jgi:hypothetical protein